MEKHLSLVPVSSTALVAEEVENVETTASRTSQIKALTEEIEQLTFGIGIVETRLEMTNELLEEHFGDELTRVDELILKVQEMERSTPFPEYDPKDDFEDDSPKSGGAAAEAIKDMFDNMYNVRDADDKTDIFLEDDAHQTSEDLEVANMRRHCKELYFAIASKTHPDRCGNTSRVNLFHDAKKALDSFNLEWLEDIYYKVFGHYHGKTNLFQRILALKAQRDLLNEKMDSLKNTQTWAMHLLELEEGRGVMLKEFGDAIRKKIKALEAILEEGEFY